MIRTSWSTSASAITRNGSSTAQRASPRAAAAFLSQAAQLDPTNPIALLDLGLVDLATEHYRAGAQAFRAGVTHMLYTCSVPTHLSTCNTPQPVTSHGLQQAWLAGAMGSLGTLANTAEASHSPPCGRRSPGRRQC